MTRDDFAHFQKPNPNRLIERGAVSVEADGTLQINKVRAYFLKELFSEEVICPKYYDSNLQHQLDELTASGNTRYEDTLFSKPEQDYLNHVLNKAEFRNGLDLRNKYCHDTCFLDEKTLDSHYCLMKPKYLKRNSDGRMNRN